MVFVARSRGEALVVFRLSVRPQSRRTAEVRPAECGKRPVVTLRPGDGCTSPRTALTIAVRFPVSSRCTFHSQFGTACLAMWWMTRSTGLMNAPHACGIGWRRPPHGNQVADIRQSGSQRLLELDPTTWSPPSERRDYGSVGHWPAAGGALGSSSADLRLGLERLAQESRSDSWRTPAKRCLRRDAGEARGMQPSTISSWHGTPAARSRSA